MSFILILIFLYKFKFFMVRRGWMLLILVILFYSRATTRLTFLVLVEISQQLLLTDKSS